VKNSFTDPNDRLYGIEITTFIPYFIVKNPSKDRIRTDFRLLIKHRSSVDAGKVLQHVM